MPRTTICTNCKTVFDADENQFCPNCHSKTDSQYEFQNSDDFLKKQAPLIQKRRKNLGLEGLVGGLNAIIINTEPKLFEKAILELLAYTGFNLDSAFEDTIFKTAVLTREGSPSILVRCRLQNENPFLQYNLNPKSEHLPNTRIETFVFEAPKLEKYVKIQQAQGVSFMSPGIEEYDAFSYIQTQPSKYIGTSYGFIHQHAAKSYFPDEFTEIPIDGLVKPDYGHLKDIYELDHTATRVRAVDRDKAIIEFMELTNYNFEFAIYVKHLNSITNVTRVSAKDFAMVFTSGITPFKTLKMTGPTEKFTYNYGTRVHHMAFRTEHIDDVYQGLRETGMDFLIELVGSEDEGLKQTFTVQSPNTLVVNEYIHRFGDFDGFFTKSNVTDLTRATESQ